MRALTLIALSAAGCGASSSGDAGQLRDGAFADLANPSGADGATDSSIGPADLATAAADAGDRLAPNPPQGTARCGHGTFSSGDAQTACLVPSFALDQGMKLPRRCDGVKLAGGEWETWCGGGSVYLFARYDTITATAKYPGCMGFTSDGVVFGWADLSNGSGQGMDAWPTAFVQQFDTTNSVTAATTKTIGQAGSAGTGNLYLVAGFNDTCMAPPTQAIVSGVAVSWDTARDGG